MELKDVFCQKRSKIRHLQRAGLQLPGGLPTGSYIHNMHEAGGAVKSISAERHRNSSLACEGCSLCKQRLNPGKQSYC